MSKDTIEIAKECGLLECIDDCYLERGDYDAQLQAFRDAIEAPLLEQNAMLRDAALIMDKMVKEALPKFNWGASFLDANTIALLNEAPRTLSEALTATEASAKAYMDKVRNEEAEVCLRIVSLHKEAIIVSAEESIQVRIRGRE